MPVVVCVDQQDQSRQQQITIPGVGVLRAIKNEVDHVPTPQGLAMTMLAQASPALAPLLQVMQVVAVALEIFAIMKLIPQAITNPTKIGEIKDRLVALQKKVGFITTFAPGIPYVVAVRDLLNTISSILRGVGTMTLRWIVELQQIKAALEAGTALGDANLVGSANCAKGHLVEVQVASQASLQDVVQLLGVVKLIVDVVKSVVPLDLPELDRVVSSVTALTTQLAGSAGPATVSTLEAEIHALQTVATELVSVADTIDSIVVKVSSFTG